MSPSHRKGGDSAARPALITGTVISLAALITWSFATSSTEPAAPASLPVSQVAASAAESSQFTCGGFSEGGGSDAEGSVVITNAADSERKVEVSVFDDQGSRASVSVSVPRFASRRIPVSGLLSGGSWLAAQVVSEGGGVAVTEQIRGRGPSISPCASSTSARWNFAGGSTDSDRTTTISLVNAGSSPAVANISFITSNEGAAAPSGSQGIVVGPHQVVGIPVKDVLAHGRDLAAMVKVTQGRMVAFATMVAPAPVGVAVTLGEPSLARRWTMARAVASPGATVSMELANPTASTQVVSIRARIPSGWLSAWQVTLDPFTVEHLEMAPSTRVPDTDVFAAEVRTSGPGVVAFVSTKVSAGGKGGWGVSPLATSADLAARSWLLPRYKGSQRSGLTLFNPGKQPVTVVGAGLSALGSATISELTQISIPAGGIVAVGTDTLGSSQGQPISVTSSGPLSVGQTLEGAVVPGILTLSGLARAR